MPIDSFVRCVPLYSGLLIACKKSNRLHSIQCKAPFDVTKHNSTNEVKDTKIKANKQSGAISFKMRKEREFEN